MQFLANNLRELLVNNYTFFGGFNYKPISDDASRESASASKLTSSQRPFTYLCHRSLMAPFSCKMSISWLNTSRYGEFCWKAKAYLKWLVSGDLVTLDIFYPFYLCLSVSLSLYMSLSISLLCLCLYHYLYVTHSFSLSLCIYTSHKNNCCAKCRRA